MGLFSGIGKALDNVVGGAAKVVGGVGKIARTLGGVLNSPLGAIIKMAFPPAAAASGMLSLVGMAGTLADTIGGGASY